MAWDFQTFMLLGEVIGRPAHTQEEGCWCKPKVLEFPEEGTIRICNEDPVKLGVHHEFDEMIALTRLEMQREGAA